MSRSNPALIEMIQQFALACVMSLAFIGGLLAPWWTAIATGIGFLAALGASRNGNRFARRASPYLGAMFAVSFLLCVGRVLGTSAHQSAGQ